MTWWRVQGEAAIDNIKTRTLNRSTITSKVTSFFWARTSERQWGQQSGMKGSLWWTKKGFGKFSMSCLTFTVCTAESSLSWRIESNSGESQMMSNVLSRAAKRKLWKCKLPTSNPPQREDSQRIADVFLSRKAEFLVFTTYIGHYDRSMSMLEESCRTSPAFAAVVHRFEVRPSQHKSRPK